MIDELKLNNGDCLERKSEKSRNFSEFSNTTSERIQWALAYSPYSMEQMYAMNDEVFAKLAGVERVSIIRRGGLPMFVEAWGDNVKSTLKSRSASRSIIRKCNTINAYLSEHPLYYELIVTKKYFPFVEKLLYIFSDIIVAERFNDFCVGAFRLFLNNNKFDQYELEDYIRNFK